MTPMDDRGVQKFQRDGAARRANADGQAGRWHRRGTVASVNIGAPEILVDENGREWKTAIRKAPVAGRVPVRGVNVAGDEQANREVHGGPDKSVYAYGTEDVDWWAVTLDRQLRPGAFGENLTVDGLDVSEAVVGERWQVGTVVLEVCQPRIPCAKLGLAMGDAVEVIDVPAHGLTVGEVIRAYHERDHAVAARMLDAPELAPMWWTWARERLAG